MICEADDSFQEEETGTEDGLKSASSKGSPCMTSIICSEEAMMEEWEENEESKEWWRVYTNEGVKMLWERTTEVVSGEK